jgi:hypothetical protein
MDINAARNQVRQLYATLEVMNKKDPEQEVRGTAVPVMDAIISSAKAHVSNDPVVATIRDVIAPESIEGEHVRVCDALIVVGALKEALGPEPPPRITIQ